MVSPTDSLILALDHGTTGVLALIRTPDGRTLGRGYAPVPSQYPKPGWVEQDPLMLWELSLQVMKEALSSANAEWAQVAGIGITNQRETVILWDQETGKPVHPAIVWQCRRTQEKCQQLIREGMTQTIREKTGLIIDPYFSATKVQWLMANVPQAENLRTQGRLRIGTVDTWIFWQLSGGSLHVTDYTNASRTLLFNIHTRDWDNDLLHTFGVSRESLPLVHPSSHHYGHSDPAHTGGKPIPLVAMVGDQQSSLFGQHCWQPGEAKCTYGTGAFLMMNLGDKPPSVCPDGLLLTLGADENGHPCYALEGSIFTAGAMLEWFCQKMEVACRPEELGKLAASVPDSGGVVLIPAFAGLGAPYWSEALGGAALLGITLGTTKAHIARAAFEAIAYRTRDVLDAMAKFIPDGALQSLRIDGGLTRSDFLVQLLANALQLPILRAEDPEVTANGAASLAAITLGLQRTPAFETQLFSPNGNPVDCQWKSRITKLLASYAQ